MTFSVFKDLTDPQKFAILITSLLVIAVSTYVTLFHLLSFDGAFNTQAAINFYSKGTLTLNYRSNTTLQTLLPFQIVNGFFLTIFGNTFLATNLANIFFYLLLFGLFIFLTCTYRSALPMLAFSCMSLSPAFLAYGSGGYGEVPALTFGLLGVSILVFRRDSYMACILAGILIAFAITTKWVLFLILPPVVLTLIMLRPDRKSLLYFLGATLFMYTLVSFLQFSHLESDEIGKLFRSLISQNTPHYGSEYFPQKVNHLKTYGLRLRKIWEGYSSMSLGFAPIKIGLSLIICFVAIHILFKRKNPLEKKDVFFIFLASFLLIYLIWAFALNSRWPARRMLNTDVLLYLGTGLLPYAASFSTIRRLAVFGLLAIFTSTHFLFFLPSMKQGHLCTVITYESRMREGLQLLPKNYNAYGSGVLEAPHWSFLAGKNFKDLFRDSVFYDCIENDCYNYLFLKSSSTLPLIKPQVDLVHKIFKLNNVFESRKFQISKIEGFNNSGKEYVESVDFTEEKAAQSIVRIHERDRDKMYAPPLFEFNEMAVFLDNKRRLPLIEVVFNAHECHDGKNLRVALVDNKGKYIQNFLVTRGENKFEVSVPKKFRGSKIDVYLLLEKELRNKSSDCMAQNINRIPLEYKIVRLIPKPSISR